MAYKASAHPKYDSNVKNIQRNLNTLLPLAEEKLMMSLWGRVSEDGYYGNDTAAAVRGFQQAFKCTPYDGIYGNQTDAALKKALSDMQGGYCAVPVSASINGASSKATNKSENYSSSDSTVGTERPVCSVNYSAEQQPKQQDDFMCKPLCTSDQTTEKQTISVNDNRKLSIKEIIINSFENFLRTFGTLKSILVTDEALTLKGIKIKDVFIELGSSIRATLKNLVFKFWDDIRATDFDSRKTMIMSEAETKKVLRHFAEIAKERGDEKATWFKNELFSDAVEKTEKGLLQKAKSLATQVVKKVARPLDIIMTFADFFELFLEERKQGQFTDKLYDKFTEACDILIVGLLAEAVAAIVVALLTPPVGPIAVFLIGIGISFVAGIIYFAITGDNPGSMTRWIGSAYDSIMNSYPIQSTIQLREQGTKDWSDNSKAWLEVRRGGGFRL